MNPIALSQCCTLLGIDPKTLRLWLKQANMALVPHPSDARLKCLTSSQLEQVAQMHGRPLSSSLLLSCDQLAAPPSQATGLSSQTELLEKLSRLETTVTTLQQHLTDLTLHLLQERTQRYEQRLQALEAYMNQAITTSGVQLRPAPLPEQGGSTRADLQPSSSKRLKTRAPSGLIPLIEYGENGAYVIICPTRGELALTPDSIPWFEWLATLSSFRFIGQQGRLSASRPAGRSCWLAYRRIHSRYYTHTLGPSQTLTLARLEQIAAKLQAYVAF
jgi:hypothetical protein